MICKKAVSDSSPAPAKTPSGITDFNEKHSNPLRVALIYAFIGAAWILITDRAVEWLFADQATLLVVQSIKGLLYVVATTVLVFWLARLAVNEARCKCAEDQYRLTQNLLQKILSSLGEAVFIIDPAKRIITECNPAAERLFGFTRAELIGQSTQILHVSQKDFEEFGALSEPILEESEVFRSEFRMRRKDGTIIDTEHTVTSINEEIGWRGGVVSIVHDNTERKRAKQSLQESEAHFQQLIELLPSAVYSCDNSGNILHYNSAAVELWGDEPRTGERFCGSYRIYLPDGTPLSKEKCPMAETLYTGKPVRNAEIVFERKDGTRVTSIVNTAPIANIEGELVGAINSLLDITELKMAEEALLESGKRFKDLAEMLPEAIFEADINLNLTYANKQAFSMFGYSKEDFAKGLNGIDMLVADDRKKARDNTARRLRGEEFGAVEYMAVRKDGSQFPILFHSTPILRQGSLEGLRGIIVDITDRKLAADEKVKIEAQLYHAQKMESVGRLAGGVAHDFNNMLSIIIGFTDMAIDTVDPAHPIISNLEEIRKAANRSADLTRQLLAFARKQTIAPEVLDLNETVEGMLKMLRRLIGEDIDLIWLPGNGLWQIKMDPSQIDQILANLCVNARDAISGVGQMTIETGNGVFDDDYCASHPGFSSGEYVKLTVSDNGCGMDKATLDRIFEPFFTTKEQGKGTGLGLATVYGIVKQNNGFIYVYSEPEQGTTFTIYLPRHFAKSEKMRKTTPAVIAEQGRETILLVEDELAILKMTTMMLEKYGYTVLAANTPGEAIRIAEAHTGMIHLVMTDVVMPEMNGRDLVRNLLFRYPNLNRLFMSGYTANVIAHHGVLDPGVNFIQKPFSMKNLAAKVREVLDDAKSPSQT